MRTRGERRRLTRRYQRRQLEKWLNYNHEEPKNTPSTEMVGKWKTISWRDCGRPNCGVCSGARRNPYITGDDRFTRQELRCEVNFNEYLDEL